MGGEVRMRWAWNGKRAVVDVDGDMEVVECECVCTWVIAAFIHEKKYNYVKRVQEKRKHTAN
jgi:hypothetical protein